EMGNRLQSHPLSIGIPLLETRQDQLESRSPRCFHVDYPAYWTRSPMFVHGYYRKTSSAYAIPNATLLSLRVTFLTLQMPSTREIISVGRLTKLPEGTEAHAWYGRCRHCRGWCASSVLPPAVLNICPQDMALAQGRHREGLACSMRSATP